MRDAAFLQAKKQRGEKITALTCYDYPTAVLEEQAGIDVLFVGDSVGTNILGYDDETQVTLDDITHHLKAVRRGAPESYILADLPYATYETPEQALTNAQHLMQNGADIIKFEGNRTDIATHLIQNGIPVCGHLGLQPQTHLKKAVQGKTFEQAKAIVEDAQRLEQTGIQLLVLELVPEEVAKLITETLQIPTIGIGAGRYTDGQVLIVNDILGITPRKLRLAKRYLSYGETTLAAMQRYQKDVAEQWFPSEDNTRHMPTEELELFINWVRSHF
ncbi:MAG: 3-methyl-2-oxobutanoate hydroxymethyltransferase [Thainema sp.]